MLLSGPIIGQENSPHIFFVRGGAGLSTLLYKPVGNYTPSMGGNIGVGYRYMLTSHWGVSTGAELGFYGGKATYNTLNGSYTVNDLTEGAFTYKYQLDNFEEKQRTILVSIPVLAHFQTGVKHVFYVSAGARIGLPVSATFDQTASHLNTSGYFPYQDLELPLQSTANYNASGDMDLKLSMMLSAEGGMRWQIGKFGLYTGLYIDYGLNNMKQEGSSQVVKYNAYAPTSPKSGSLLNAPQTNKVQTLSCGLRLSLSFAPFKQSTPAGN